MNRGSVYASEAGLFHYTTSTNQTLEWVSPVDIGFHTVPLTNSLTGELIPADSDRDGVPDYIEDANGNAGSDDATDYLNRVSNGQQPDFVVTDDEPPFIYITRPLNPVVARGYIHLDGYCEERLRSIGYTVYTNGVASASGQGAITNQTWNKHIRYFTTNFFRCHDLPLSPGLNTIVLQAVDFHGNVASRTVSYTLDYNTDLSAPALALQWPSNGVAVSGDTFTMRGTTDNPSAGIVVTVGSSSGTNEFYGIASTDGQYWVPDVALGAGTNTVTMVSTSPAGVASTNSLTLIRSGELIGITVESNAFTSFNYDRSARVGVETTNDDLTITVNGQSASMVQQVGNVFYWIADDVPGTEDGWMELTAVAEPIGGGTPIAAQYEWEKPPLLRMKEYHLDTGYTGNELTSYYQEHEQLDYVRNSGGSYRKDYYNGCTETWGWNADDSPTPYVMTCTNGYAYTNMAGNGPPPNELDELTDVTLTEEGANYFWTFHRTMDQQIELRAGGKPYAGRVDLVKLLVFEPEEIGYDFPGDAPPPFSAFEAGAIDGTTISVMGSAADGSGYVYAQVAPGSVQNATPVVPKASQEMQLAVSQAKLQIIRDGTTDITGKTNRVIVGERIALECKLDNTNVAIITNFNWEVPGNVVSEFITTANYGEGLALTNKTNSAVTFYWVEGGKILDVTCNVIANGKSLTAKSTFLVLPAIGTLQADFLTNVVINGGTNVSLGGNPIPGVRFMGVGYAPYGPISQGKWEFCQILLAGEFRVNVNTNVTGGNPQSLVFSITNGLDRWYPYPTLVTNENIRACLQN